MAEEEAFRVTDRRARPVEPRAEEAPLRPNAPGPGRPQSDPADRESAPPPDEREPEAGPLDLQGLFIMFASSALIGLGAARDPVSGEQGIDLEQAQEAIETLLLLRDKTTGNRTEEESRLLEDILYDLQMRYVGLAKGQNPTA